MADPDEPYGKAVSALANDPVAGRPTETTGLQATSKHSQKDASVETSALRKRGRSSDDASSPETSSQLLDERKKTKSNEVRMPQNPNARTLQEHCVFCELKDSKMNMVKCDQCDDFYHLACCGLPAKKHEIAFEMILLLGWSCKDCRINNRNFKIKM